jgi:hypothetical protein
MGPDELCRMVWRAASCAGTDTVRMRSRARLDAAAKFRFADEAARGATAVACCSPRTSFHA